MKKSKYRRKFVTKTGKQKIVLGEIATKKHR